MSSSAEAAAGATYNDRVVRQFALMTIVWGVVGMRVGLLLAAAAGAFFWAVNNDQFEDLDHVADGAVADDPPPAALPKEPR